jgi:hypothetical protein
MAASVYSDKLHQNSDYVISNNKGNKRTRHNNFHADELIQLNE